MTTPNVNSNMWNTTAYVGVQAKGDYRPYTIGNWAVSNPAGMDRTNDRYAGNVVFGAKMIYGRCLSYEDRLTLGIQGKLGTDCAIEADASYKTTQHIIKPGFAISTETSARAEAGCNFEELNYRSNQEHLGYTKYEADIKSGPLFRFDNHRRKVGNITEVRPYVGVGFKGKSTWDKDNPTQTKAEVQALVGSEVKVRFINDKHKGLYGAYLKADVNNTEASVGFGYGF